MKGDKKIKFPYSNQIPDPRIMKIPEENDIENMDPNLIQHSYLPPKGKMVPQKYLPHNGYEFDSYKNPQYFELGKPFDQNNWNYAGYNESNHSNYY